MESPKTRPKTRGKFRLFRCCSISQDDVVSPRMKMNNSDPLLTYISVAERRPVSLPSILSSVFTVAKGGSGESSPSPRKKLGKDKSIRQVLIAVFSHMSLAKKIGSKRKTSNGYLSKSSSRNLEGESEKICNTEYYSSNASSFIQRSGSLRINEDSRKLNSGPNVALCFLFITSLMVLIMWGKLCAIVCTSTGFFVVPHRQRKPSNEVARCESSKSIRLKK
ncbi:hypothetical protein VNO77_37233 [Canavalia gladiata]|uniref:Uncharacterized protein n=1 Tax=Canavalia gladiata TaxID=3824 RepID=A0AAN9KAM1_CANGL